MKIKIALAITAALVLSAATAQADGDAAQGKVAFTKHGCWQCHGFEGQGSASTSNNKVLAHDPIPWEAFYGFVRTSNTGMPPYDEKILPDGDLENIYAYLKAQPAPKAVKDIPLLSATP